MLYFFVFNDTATTEIYTYLTHSFPTRRSSDLLKACRVQEVHKLDLADLARLGVAGDHHRHRAVLADGERLRAFGDVDVGLKRIAVVDRKSTRLNSSH